MFFAMTVGYRAARRDPFADIIVEASKLAQNSSFLLIVTFSLGSVV
jgi:hypothetical protein